MVAASANLTSSSTRSYKDFIGRPPARFQREPKEPGSMKLVFGRWVEVQPGDDDAIKNGPAQSSSGVGGSSSRDGAL